MTVIVIACAAFVSTLVGGLVALKLRDKLHLILGFSAGAVIGVAFFDLLPESIELGEKYFARGTVTGVVALGFLVYLILDRLVFLDHQIGLPCPLQSLCNEAPNPSMTNKHGMACEARDG